MKITFNKKVRNIEAGTEIDLSILDVGKSVAVVGNNGSGKSTILQAIRGSFPKTTKSFFEDDCKNLVKDGGVVLEHNYEKAFFLDAVLDNGLHFMNACDAPSFIRMGGFSKSKKSHGEGNLIDIARFMTEVEPKIVPDKTLIVFDEIDNGFSLRNMSLISNLIDKLVIKHKCHVIVSTHNPFYISQSGFCYDVEDFKIKKSSKYIEEKTGYIITKPETK